ncbi:MAG: menaquinone biosynthesis protein, partial [Bacteroidota bacterium]
GLGQIFSKDEARLHLMPPADCATYLAEGKCQLSLMPIGALSLFDRAAILPNYCIGAEGAVESVYIFSQRPIQELDTLILDRHSRTSNGLARILLEHHWGKRLNLVQAEQKHFHLIEGTTGGVVIGDHAIRIREQYAYTYDLAEYWQLMTGLPFVFAVWVYRPGELTGIDKQRLNVAFRTGVRQRRETAERWAVPFDIPLDFARHYLENCIDYQFDSGKHRALNLYQDLLVKLSAPVKMLA